MSVTPLRLALKSLIWAFRDSACAFVLLLLKKASIPSKWFKTASLAVLKGSGLFSGE